MVDREEDDLQMALRMSLQGSPPEAKRSKPREIVEESPEARNRRLQRELMAAAAEKRIRAAGDKIVCPAKPRVETVGRKVAAAGTLVSRSEEAKVKEEDTAVKVEKVEKLEKEERELDLGEELAPEVVDQLFSMVFGSDVSREILAQWSNQGIRYGHIVIQWFESIFLIVCFMVTVLIMF